MKDQRVTRLATFTMIVAGLFAIYLPVSILTWLVPFAFTDPARWLALPYVNAEAIPITTRALYFVVWMTTIAAGTASVLAGIRVLDVYRRGAYFSEEAFRWIFRLGVMILLAMAADTLVGATNTAIQTMHNSQGTRMVRLVVDTGDISLALCGLGFCMIGWVMQIARRLQAENESFV